MVFYEWDCELQADGDSADYEDCESVDHFHGATFVEVTEWARTHPCDSGFKYVIVLVRDSDVCGPRDTGRTWAYMDDNTLPDHFMDLYGHDAAKVPQRFQREVAALLKANV